LWSTSSTFGWHLFGWGCDKHIGQTVTCTSASSPPETFDYLVQVLDLMAKDLEHMGQMTCEVKKARWARILDALRLSRPQQDALLLLRKQHLKKLHDVYEQRQRLNMQVRTCAVMLDSPRVVTDVLRYALWELTTRKSMLVSRPAVLSHSKRLICCVNGSGQASMHIQSVARHTNSLGPHVTLVWCRPWA